MGLWEFDFSLLGVNFKYLPVNSGFLRVDFRPLEMNFLPLVPNRFWAIGVAFVCDSISGPWEFRFFSLSRS